MCIYICTDAETWSSFRTHCGTVRKTTVILVHSAVVIESAVCEGWPHAEVAVVEPLQRLAQEMRGRVPEDLNRVN